MEVSLRIEAQNKLGEGIVWIPAKASEPGFFLCVDIHGRKILQFDEDGGALRTWDTPERVGWVLPTAVADSYLAGFQSGFAHITLGSTVQVNSLLPAFPGHPELRLNDAMADSTGAVWAGSLNCDDESQPVGCLMRYTASVGIQVMDTGYCVTNGPAMSPDETLFLHTNSAQQTIYAFDLDVQRGTLVNKRIWKTFTEAEGYPDGMTFDAAGRVWVAHWGAGLISQFTQAGDLLQRVKLPVSNVTNMAFGGPHLDRMFVTTARGGLPEGALQHEPLAGAIFEVRGHGAVGLPANICG